jgi:diamine N-acetyltransferase
VTADVTLREIDADNVRAICELKLGPGQDHYVAPAAYTIAEGAYDPNASMWAIYWGSDPVGLIAVIDDGGYHKIVRLMIDAAHQRRGLGARAMKLLHDDYRARGVKELFVSYREGPGEPRAFYEGLGYEPTGRREYNEPVLRLEL